MVKYCSVFSSLIEKYVNYQKASSSWSETRQRNIMYFDSFCAMHYPEEQRCQEMIDAWCAKRETENNTSCITRTAVIRSFIKYLRHRNLTDILPTDPPKPEKKTYIPHAFTFTELEHFFHECGPMSIPWTQKVERLCHFF